MTNTFPPKRPVHQIDSLTGFCVLGRQQHSRQKGPSFLLYLYGAESSRIPSTSPCPQLFNVHQRLPLTLHEILLLISKLISYGELTVADNHPSACETIHDPTDTYLAAGHQFFTCSG